jgi:hypothetical protein
MKFLDFLQGLPIPILLAATLCLAVHEVLRKRGLT